MKSYLRATDREDNKTASTIREKHERDFRVIDEALEIVIRGLEGDFGGRDLDPYDELEIARYLLATRSFNSIRVARQVLERGYYQQAMSLVRMASEDQLIAMDAEIHAPTLRALLHDEGKLGRGKLTYGQMAKRQSAKREEVWGNDYGYLSEHTHPRFKGMVALVQFGPYGQKFVKPGSHYSELSVNITLYYMARETLRMSAVVHKLTASAGTDWQSSALPNLAKVDCLWRQIDAKTRSQVEEGILTVIR